MASARAVPARVEAVQLEHVVSGSCLLAASSRRNIEMGRSGGAPKMNASSKIGNYKIVTSIRSGSIGSDWLIADQTKFG